MSPFLFWIIIIIIITGGSRGIGWEAAKDLLKQGAKIIFGNRTIKNTVLLL